MELAAGSIAGAVTEREASVLRSLGAAFVSHYHNIHESGVRNRFGRNTEVPWSCPESADNNLKRDTGKHNDK